MKTVFLFLSIILTVNLQAQNNSQWPEKFEEFSYLEVFDQELNSGQLYKESQIFLKAGEGAFFFMLAGEFLPQIYLTDTLMRQWSNGTPAEFIPGLNLSQISIIPKKDTALKVIYSTVEKGITGDYIYGYRILSAKQMQFENSGSYCDKIAYLISNWQCMWGLVSIPDFTPSGELGKSSAKNSLVNGGVGALQINGITDYHEILYQMENALLAKSKYEEVVANTKSCLNVAEWEITTDDNIDPTTGEQILKTNFIIIGATEKDPTGSFVISTSCDKEMGCNVYIDFY